MYPDPGPFHQIPDQRQVLHTDAEFHKNVSIRFCVIPTFETDPEQNPHPDLDPSRKFITLSLFKHQVLSK